MLSQVSARESVYEESKTEEDRRSKDGFREVYIELATKILDSDGMLDLYTRKMSLMFLSASENSSHAFP